MKVLDWVIVGGGISGVSAAFFAQKQKQSYALLESSSRLLGKIQTSKFDVPGIGEFMLEHGADSFLTIKPWALALFKELGLEEEFLETKPERTIYVLKNQKLTPMPKGMFLLLPTQLGPFLKSPLFSLRAKLRMGLDLILPRRNSQEDESLSAFVKRRLGQEALNLIGEPILSGIYNGSPEKQSLRATFPILADLEQKHRSLHLGFRKLQGLKKKNPQYSSPFISLKNGMGSLRETFERTLQGDIRLNTGAFSIEKRPGGYKILLSTGESLFTKQVLCTLSPKRSSALLPVGHEDTQKTLESLTSSSSAFSYIAFNKDEVPALPKGYGLVIPRREKRAINAITFVSQKLEGRAPENCVLLRVFFGGHKNPKIIELTEPEQEKIVLREIADLLELKAKPLFVKTFQHTHNNPQYEVGHLAKMELIMSQLPNGFHLAGCAFGGVGIPDCVKQAQHLFIPETKNGMP